MYRSRIQSGIRVSTRLLGAFAACALLAPAAASANTIFFDLDREDDFVFPLAAFAAFINIDLDDPNVTGVTVTMGTISVPLTKSPDGTWEDDNGVNFTSLADLKQSVSGTWTVSISGGGGPSTSTFTVNANGLLDSDFPPTATGLSPAHGATGVSANALLSWTAVPLQKVLDVFAGNDLGEQEVLSVIGEIALGASSWQPPLPLADGFNEWGVFYARDPMLTVDLVGDIVVTQGSILWSPHPLTQFLAPAWPTTKPMMIIASDKIVSITVPEPAEMLQAGTALAALALLAGLRSRLRFGAA